MPEVRSLMKFSVSTTFAIVTIVALIVGWATERSRRLAQAESHVQERQSLKGANRSIGAAIEAMRLAYRLQDASNDQRMLVLDANLISNTLEIWQNHEAVSYALDQTHCRGMTSHAVVSGLLDALRCATPEEFQARVSQVHKTDPTLLPENLSDLTTSNFDCFLQTSINYYSDTY